MVSLSEGEFAGFDYICDYVIILFAFAKWINILFKSENYTLQFWLLSIQGQ